MGIGAASGGAVLIQDATRAAVEGPLAAALGGISRAVGGG